jgi:hypothetical protein
MSETESKPDPPTDFLNPTITDDQADMVIGVIFTAVVNHENAPPVALKTAEGMSEPLIDAGIVRAVMPPWQPVAKKLVASLNADQKRAVACLLAVCYQQGTNVRKIVNGSNNHG